MAHWARQELAARHYAATTAGFIPSVHVATVRLSGNPLMYTMNMGYNVYTPQGEEAVNFQYALYYFCLDLCSQGAGDLPYNPNPFGGGLPPLPQQLHPVPQPQPGQQPPPGPQPPPEQQPQPGQQPPQAQQPQAEQQPPPEQPPQQAAAAPNIPDNLAPNVGVVIPVVQPQAVVENDIADDVIVLDY